MSGVETLYPTHHAPVGQMVLESFPEVANMTRFSRPHSRTFKHNEETIMVEDIYYVDSSFFDIFSFKLIEGQIKTALNRPNTVVLTQKVKQLFFGKENAIGQVIESEGKPYMVSGVIEDPPANSSLQFQILEPMATPTKEMGGFSWGYGMGFQTWLLLKEGTNTEELEDKIAIMMDKTVNELFKSINAKIYGFLEPLDDIYLNSKVDRQTIKGDKRTIAIFSISAILVLLIACFNFVNLSTAQAMLRSKEVGVRKVFGASRAQLMLQHLGESFLMIFLALIISLFLAELASPLVESVSGKPLNIYSSQSIYLLVGIPSLILIVGLGAGWYPAFFLSTFSPTSILNQSNKKGGRTKVFRNILSFLQFAILQALAICTILVFLQLQYIKRKDMGFKTENLLVARINSKELEGKHESLKERLNANANVESSSVHSFILGHTILARDFVFEGSPEAQNVAYITVDESFINTYGIELKEGRNFRYPIENETRAMIVNEAFVKQFGYKNPIGRKIFLPNDSNHKENEIVGVVKDFNFLSLHREVDPIVMMTWHDPFQYISIKLKDNDLPMAIGSIKQTWEEIVGDSPLSYFFMDNKIDELYLKDFRFGNILGIFTMLAIAIACSGLFGLTAHITQSRSKEIAIRKVLGASSGMVTTMISVGFTKWVLLGAVIAWPVSWYIMSNWLDNFANRINLSISAFITATALAFVIALLTTSFKTIAAANQNPADTLKHE
jgi:putative ABC transport system permease protein